MRKADSAFSLVDGLALFCDVYQVGMVTCDTKVKQLLTLVTNCVNFKAFRSPQCGTKQVQEELTLCALSRKCYLN